MVVRTSGLEPHLAICTLRGAGARPFQSSSGEKQRELGSVRGRQVERDKRAAGRQPSSRLLGPRPPVGQERLTLQAN